MSRQLRLEFPGSLWHITHRGNERRAIFFDDDDRATFLERLAKTVERFRWIVTAYALMPNHYHFVVELTEDNTLSRGVKWLDGGYAQYVNWRHDRVGHLYQGRFRAVLIEKETHALEVLRYVVLNPVRGSLVARPEEYEWTSHRAVLATTATPSWLSVDRVLAQFGRNDAVARETYRRFVEEGIGSGRCPWDDLVGGMYLGSEQWIEDLRSRIEATPRSVEHPIAQREVARPEMSRIISAVATTFRMTDERIRWERGGVVRMAAAWLGWNEGGLRGEQIAAALRIRSVGRVTQLAQECESRLTHDVDLRASIDACLATLRRETKN